MPRGAKLKQIVATAYHPLDAYGFHALEAVQALAERRQGGETGIKRVRCLTGKAGRGTDSGDSLAGDQVPVQLELATTATSSPGTPDSIAMTGSTANHGKTVLRLRVRVNRDSY